MPSHSVLALRSSSTDITTSPAIHPRYTQEVLWCAPGTSTYIVATLRTFVGNPRMITDLLRDASHVIQLAINLHGDGPLDTGRFEWSSFAPGMWVQLAVQNANNHQISYGVLKAATDALNEYMMWVGYGLVQALTIYDGSNEVATGTLNIVPQRKR